MAQELFDRLFTTTQIPLGRRAVIVCSALAVMVLVAVVDVRTGNTMEWSIVYAVCVAIIAWYGTLWLGMLSSLFAGMLTLSTALIAGGPTARGEAVTAIPIAVILGLLAISLTILRHSLSVANELARTDPLTGAANSRALYEAAGNELLRSRRYGRAFTVAFLDLDDFKDVNDRFGHATGDEILRTLVRTLEAETRETDVLGRVGGDEFVLLLPETGAEAATVVLDKLQERVHDQLRHRDAEVGVSVGAITFTEPPASVDDMLRMADGAMYEAKHAGKGCYRQHTFPGDAARMVTMPADAVGERATA